MHDKFHSIDATNKKAPKLQTYIDAKAAFDADMKTLNIHSTFLSSIQNFIDLKQISSTKPDWGDVDHLKELKIEAESINKDSPDPEMGIILAEIDKRLAPKLAAEKDKNKNISTATNILNTNQETQEQVQNAFFEKDKP